MFKKYKKVLGVEVNDKYIKVIELTEGEDKPYISSFNKVELEEGVVTSGRIKNKEKFSMSFKQALKKARPGAIKTKELYFALPDNLVFSHPFKSRIQSKSGIRNVVRKEYKRIFPHKPDDGEFAYRVLDRNHSIQTKESLILLVASEKKSLLSWQNFFESEGFELPYFDLASLAIHRSIFSSYQNGNIILLEIKDEISKILLFSEIGLELDLSFALSVEDWGKKDFEGDDFEKIKAAFSFIKKELSSSSRSDYKIVISGQGFSIDSIKSKLQELFDGHKLEFLASRIELESSEEGFNQAIGLALRPFEHQWEKTDPFLPTIGHIYELAKKEFLKFPLLLYIVKHIKKTLAFILVLAMLVFIFLYVGTIKTSLESENIDQEEPETSSEKYSPIGNTLTEDEKKEEFVIVDDIGMPLNVRTGPGTDNPIIGTVQPGSEQILLEEAEGWCRIEWPNEESAWLSSAYVTKAE